MSNIATENVGAKQPAPAFDITDNQVIAKSIFANAAEVHLNVQQQVIITTEDKVRLCLQSHLGKMEQRGRWMTPAGILLTIIGAFTTATFHDALKLSAAIWQALFILIGVVSAIWFLRALIAAGTSFTLSDVVAELKKDSQQLLKRK